MPKNHGTGIDLFKKKVGFSVLMSLGPWLNSLIQGAPFDSDTSFNKHSPNASSLPGTLCWAQWIQKSARPSFSFKGSQSKERDTALWLCQANIAVGVTVLLRAIKPYTCLILSNHTSYNTDRDIWALRGYRLCTQKHGHSLEDISLMSPRQEASPEP